jgi:hypothetical protein
MNFLLFLFSSIKCEFRANITAFVALIFTAAALVLGWVSVLRRGNASPWAADRLELVLLGEKEKHFNDVNSIYKM